MSTLIEDIASVHLGKNADGSVNNRYETPDRYDSNLLVRVPRELNRSQYNIENGEQGSIGIDIWNSYEVSFLTSFGAPVNCIVRLIYPSTNEYIVESKSLKLYFNSFNLHKFSNTVEESTKNFVDIVRLDLYNLLETPIEVIIFPISKDHKLYTFPDIQYLESTNLDKCDFSHYNETPNLLKHSVFKELKCRTSLLRSNCRVTNQPDWGDVYIWMKSSSGTPTKQSLLSYIVSMRKENHFHEEICECIFKRLYDTFKPDDMVVACFYTRRGGIDINPIRYTSESFMKEFLHGIKYELFKTNRQ